MKYVKGKLDEMVGWHHRSDGPEFEQAPGVGDRQGSPVCYSPWGCRRSDMTERLNWTEVWRKTRAFCTPKLQHCWESPGKPEHALSVGQKSLYCPPVEVKVLVTQSSLILFDPMDCSLPGSSVHGILQVRILDWLSIPLSSWFSWPGIKPRSPALQADSLPSEPPG